MPDNLKIKAPQDPKKINIHQDHEIKYWTEKLNITEQQLREAVRTVGVMVDDIKRHLKK
ncbi:MAG: DUF3606 domain-containing protein [Magnetococcales bacterium]|nr:DUF3606 domain-containing protein [Magnetococcales bacterium]